MAQRRARCAGEEPARAGLGRGEVGWNGAGAGRAACAAGPKARRRPAKTKKTLFHLYFQELFKSQLSNLILSKKMTSFENVPKMKVA